jgi:lactose/L-arabinose transport system ATP-binding protein
VDFAEYLGSTRYLYCYLPSGETITVEQRDGRDLAAGDQVFLNCDPQRIRLFSETGNRLRSAAKLAVTA